MGPKNDIPNDFINFPKEPVFTSAGVVVYGYGDGWIKNTNNFPVKIWMVRIYGTGGADETNWIFTFQPGQIKKVRATNKTLFHIYDMEGKPIGFIHSEPTKKGE